jgi:hypothetical protein
MSIAVDDFPSLDEAVLVDKDPDDEGAPRTRRRRSDAGTPRRGRTSSSAKLAEELLDPMAKLGQAVAFTLPTTGAVIIARSEETTKALVKFAEGHPKMLAALKRVSKVGPASEVIETIAMCLIAAQMDMGNLSVDHPLGKLTGVSAIHIEMVGHMYTQTAEQNHADAGFGNFNMTPPPAYPGDGWSPDGTWAAPPMFRAGPGADVRHGNTQP